MNEFIVKRPLGTAGWWVVEGEWNPPKTRVVAQFRILSEAIKYAQWRSESDRGRPVAGLSDEVVSYALRAAKGKFGRAAEILGVSRRTLYRYIQRRLGL